MTQLRTTLPAENQPESLPSKTIPRPRAATIFTRSTVESLPKSKSIASLVVRAGPPAETVRSRIVTRVAPLKLNGSVSAAALDEFWITVVSIPSPANVMSEMSPGLKKSLPRSNVPAEKLTVPPPVWLRSETALSTTDLSAPVNVVPVVCDCARYVLPFRVTT